LREFENKVLRKVFGLNREKILLNFAGNFIKVILILCTPVQLLLNRMKWEAKGGQGIDTLARNDKCKQDFSRKT
jgi:hypothetical protein